MPHSIAVPQILFVEDDLSFRKAASAALPQEVVVVAASTSGEAKARLKAQSFDLILLDLSLPDEDGFRFCSWVRNDPRHQNTPIIFLTGRSDVEDKVLAFSVGADDYLTKPVHPTEFKARILAKLKQARQRAASERVFCLGNLKFVVPRQQLFILGDSGAERIETTPIEFRLLLLLAESEGRIFSRDELMNAGWGVNVHVLDRTVDSHLSDLRKKLAGASHSIKAVRGLGYQLAAKQSPARGKQAA